MTSDVLEYNVTKRCVKKLRIEHLGGKVCFTYPQNMRNPQMFFSASISSRDVVETFRSKDPINVCVTKLQKECEEFDFLLYASHYNAQDAKIIILNHGKIPFRTKSQDMK